MKQVDRPLFCQRSPRLRYVRRGAKTTIAFSFSSHLPYTGEATNDNSSAHLQTARHAPLAGKLSPLITKQTWSCGHRSTISGSIAAVFVAAMVLVYVALVGRVELMPTATVIFIGKG